MHEQKADNGDHAEEVHEPRALEIVEQIGQLRELHRLPDRQTREHLDDDDHDDADVEQPLDGVVAGEIIVGELERQRRANSAMISAMRIGSSMRRKRPVISP